MGGRRVFWDDAEVVAVGVEVAGALPSPQLGEVAGRVAVGDEDGPSDTSGVGLAPKPPAAGGRHERQQHCQWVFSRGTWRHRSRGCSQKLVKIRAALASGNLRQCGAQLVHVLGFEEKEIPFIHHPPFVQLCGGEGVHALSVSSAFIPSDSGPVCKPVRGPKPVPKKTGPGQGKKILKKITLPGPGMLRK